MLYLSGLAQVMEAAEKYQCVVWEKLKFLDSHFVCHVDNQCYKSYTHAKNLKGYWLMLKGYWLLVTGFYIYFASLEHDIAAT